MYNCRMTSQRGNALFIILIGIVLFAALSYAVTQSTRGGGDMGAGEKATVQATDIVSYGNQVATAVKSMMALNGCKDTQISFENPVIAGYENPNAPADKSCNVFDAAGGGLNWQKFSQDALASCCTGGMTAAAYGHPLYTGKGDANGVGSTKADGSGSVATADLKIIVPQLSKDTCIKINEKLGVTGAGVSPPGVCGSAYSALTQKFGGAYLTGSSCSSTGTGVSAACVYDAYNNGIYYFYKILIAR